MSPDIFTMALLFSGIVYLSLALFVFWYFWSTPGAKSFVGLMLAACIYSLGYYGELHSSMSFVFFWLEIEYIGIAPFAVLFLLFVIQYAKRERYLRLSAVLALFVIPFITYLAIYNNSDHHFFYKSMYLVTRDGLSLLYTVKGPWYWVHIVYQNILVVIGNLILLQMWRQTPAPLNRQYAALFLGSLVPWAGMIIYLTGNSPLNLDLSPFGMVFTGWIYLYSLMHYRFFDMIPVASTVVLDKMRDGVLVVDTQNRIADMNAAAVKFFGKKTDIIGRQLDSLFYPVSGEAVSVNESRGHLEFEENTPNGNHWLDLLFSPLTAKEGQVRGHAVIIRDITKRKLAQAQLEMTNNELSILNRELDEYNRNMQQMTEFTVNLQACTEMEQTYPVIVDYLQSILPMLGGGLYSYDPEEGVMELVSSWNNTTAIHTEFKNEDCQGLIKSEVHRAGVNEDDLRCTHVQPIKGGNYACHPIMIEGIPFAMLHFHYVDSELSDNQLQIARLSADAIKLALVSLKMKQNLRQESIRDPLTGLFNRRYMSEALGMEIAQAERIGKPLAVIMIDVDYYKEINDRYGHSMGDQVLIQVSRIFAESIRRGDIACRFGGDEFVLVLPGASLAVGIQRAESIRHKVTNMKFRINEENSEGITLSIGVASYPSQANTVDTLLKTADQALYRAKEAGRNQTMAAES